MGFINVSILVLLVLLVLQNLMFYKVRELLIQPPSAPIGPLKPNNKLENAQILFENIYVGPESHAFYNGALYSTVETGYIKIVNDKIVKEIRVAKPGCVYPEGCGRPLGIRHYHDETFLAADCYHGIVEVDFNTETVKTLLSIETVINGRRLMFPDDFDYISNDTIIFSDATVTWDLHRFGVSVVSGVNDGRLIKFNLKTREYELIADGFYFANGIQIHADRQSVLVAETGFGRVQRIYFDGPKKGVRENFIEQLPGFPDNIRATTRGTYFVALALSRIGGLNLLDLLAPYPSLRKLLLQIVPEKYVTPLFLAFSSGTGVFIEVDQNGAIIDSWQDPSGKLRFISQATDTSDAIYVGSYGHRFLAKINR